VLRAAGRLERPVRGLSAAVGELLLAYPWPGNVRELESCIERAVAVARTEELTIDDLPERLLGRPAGPPPVARVDPGALLSMEEVERRHILRVVAAVGSKAEAATVLGMHPSTLYRKLEHYGHGNGGPGQ
jgi:two-component system response regulator HydG